MNLISENRQRKDGQLSPFIDLSRTDTVALDTEGTGLRYRDRPVGLSYCTPGGRKGYLAWGHEGGGNNCSLAQVIEWARRELPGKKVVFHNAAYDLRMLSYVGVPVPTDRVEDTGIALAVVNEHAESRSLGDLTQAYCGFTKSDEGLNQYCANRFGGQPTRRAQAKNYWRAPATEVYDYASDDGLCTMRLYEALRPLVDKEGVGEIYALESALIPIVLRMHLAGVPVDVAKAERVKAELTEMYERLLEEWHAEVGFVNIASGKQLAPIFEERGVPVWYTEKGNPSITKEYLETVDHPLGKKLRALRQLSHYAGTFVDSYILENVQGDGRIHGEFHQVKTERYGTISGRFSSGGGLNLQNLPARDERWAPLLRGLFVPVSPDHEWVKFDYSQIEYRFFAHYAGGKLREAYNQNPDQDFHKMVMELTGLERKPAKNANFAKLYGAGIARFALTCGISEEKAAEIMATYDARIPEGKATYQRAMNRAAARGFIVTWGGRKLRFKKQGGRYDMTYAALNRLLQGSSADLTKKAMVDIGNNVVDWSSTVMHLTVHDELDFSIPRGDDATKRRIKEAMQDYQLTVPVVAECEVGENWGDTEKWVDPQGDPAPRIGSRVGCVNPPIAA